MPVCLHAWIARGYTKRTEVGQLRLEWLQGREEPWAGIEQHHQVMNLLKRDVVLL